MGSDKGSKPIRSAGEGAVNTMSISGMSSGVRSRLGGVVATSVVVVLSQSPTASQVDVGESEPFELSGVWDGPRGSYEITGGAQLVAAEDLGGCDHAGSVQAELPSEVVVGETYTISISFYDSENDCAGTGASGTLAVGSYASMEVCGEFPSNFEEAGQSFCETLERQGVPVSIEIRAWIPTPTAVDPTHPIDRDWRPFAEVFPDTAATRALVRAIPDSLLPCVESLPAFIQIRGEGDGHAQFEGSARVRVMAQFIYDGDSVTDFSFDSAHAVSRRIVSATREGLAQKTCIQEAPNTRGAGTTAYRGSEGLRLSASAHGREVTMSIGEGTSIAPEAVTPAITASATFEFNGPPSDPVVSADYTTDQYPSHGYRLVVDGTERARVVTHDVSCRSALGVVGMANLVLGLSTARESVAVADVTQERDAICNPAPMLDPDGGPLSPRELVEDLGSSASASQFSALMSWIVTERLKVSQ